MRWYKVSELIAADQSVIRPIKVDGRPLLLIYQNGQYTVAKRYCPHAGADLANGWCKEGKLVCPHHRYQYDLISGRGDPGQNDYLDVYPLKIETDGVYVGFPESGWKRIKQIFKL